MKLEEDFDSKNSYAIYFKIDAQALPSNATTICQCNWQLQTDLKGVRTNKMCLFLLKHREVVPVLLDINVKNLFAQRQIYVQYRRISSSKTFNNSCTQLPVFCFCKQRSLNNLPHISTHLNLVEKGGHWLTGQEVKKFNRKHSWIFGNYLNK